MKVNELKRKSDISKHNKSFQINHNNIKIGNNKENFLIKNYIQNTTYRKKNTINITKSPFPITQKKIISSSNYQRKTFTILKKKKSDNIKSYNIDKEINLIYNNMIENKSKKIMIWRREFQELIQKTKSINSDFPIPKALNSIGSNLFRNYKFWILYIEYNFQKINFENLVKIMKNCINYLNNNQELNKIKIFFNNYINENNIPISDINLFCEENNLDLPINGYYDYIIINKNIFEQKTISKNRKNENLNDSFSLDIQNTFKELEKCFKKGEEAEKQYKKLKKESTTLKKINIENDNEYNSIINESSFIFIPSHKNIEIAEELNKYIKNNECNKTPVQKYIKDEQNESEDSYKKYLKFMAEKRKNENKVSNFNYN
jgi:hypothetical protein